MEEVLIAFLLKKGLKNPEVQLVVPTEEAHGDYTTNAALVYAKGLGVAPQILAEELAEVVRTIDAVEKVEVIAPGFVNIHLKSAALSAVVPTILTQHEAWGSNQSLQHKTILIEKSAPNLFKPFHVGHLLNLSIGESLARLIRFAGAQVVDACYPSDISLGVAKAVWALLHSGTTKNLSVHDLGKAYVEGTKRYDEDERAKSEIIEINKKINEGVPGEELDLYTQGVKLNLAYFKEVTARLGSFFDATFFESEAGKVGRTIVLQNGGKVFTESEGAVIFKGEEYGLHTRVFITSLGLPVYEAKDIGLLKLKFDAYHPDLSIVITDVEQKQYFEVIRKVASLIEPSWAERSLYWQHGRLRFEGSKISSRYGNVPLAEDLLDAVKEKVAEYVTQSARGLSQEGEDALSEHIALGALKYAFLKPSAGQNIVFDFERSVSLKGDSGPYVQYAYARACSIIATATEAGIQPTIDSHIMGNERSVLRHLIQFPDVVARAQKEFAPHHIAQYAGELASLYNSWYTKDHVMGTPEVAHRVAVTKAVAITLKNALTLLAIPTPERV